MKIESLKTTPDRAGRYWVILDDGSRLALYRQTVEDFGLYTGKEFSPQEWENLQEAAGKMSAKMRAIRIVSASSVSKKELQYRMVQKGEDPDHAQQAIAWMEELNLLNDRKTAENIVHSCIAKGYGISRAKQVLYEKKIPKSIWDEVLEDYPDQLDKITNFLRTKLGQNWDQKDLKRAIDAAMRRGHSYGAIRQALSRLEAETDEFPEEW